MKSMKVKAFKSVSVVIRRLLIKVLQMFYIP